MSSSAAPHVLFLTTLDPEAVKTDWNWELPLAISAAQSGIKVTILSWHSPPLNPVILAESYTHICFMNLYYYNHLIEPIFTLLTETLPAAQKINPSLRMLNDPLLVAWNADKAYLTDLEHAGFRIPRTAFLRGSQSLQELHSALLSFQSFPGQHLVLKPSTGASGIDCERIKDASKCTEKDDAFLLDLASRTEGRKTIVLQEFIPEIKSRGEWSVMYVRGQYIGAYVKMVSTQNDEFRTQSEYGGKNAFVEDDRVPRVAKEVGKRAWEWLEERFGEGSCAYLRLDGIERLNGDFIIMELEAINPCMQFQHEKLGTKVIDAFVATLLDSNL